MDGTLVVFQFLFATEECIYPNPPLQERCEFSFSQTSCLTKVKEPCLTYLPLTGDRFVPFFRVLQPSETQTAVWRI